uniref:Uncharacterized protein n=1 Tax=Arundo donax TaxID=35708 RepID=A0A0A9GCQ8_ARUDO
MVAGRCPSGDRSRPLRLMSTMPTPWRMLYTGPMGVPVCR